MENECCCVSGREGLKREAWTDTVFHSPFSGLINLVLFVPLNPIHTYNFLNWRLGSLLGELLMPWTDRQTDNSRVGLKSQFRCSTKDSMAQSLRIRIHKASTVYIYVSWGTYINILSENGPPFLCSSVGSTVCLKAWLWSVHRLNFKSHEKSLAVIGPSGRNKYFFLLERSKIFYSVPHEWMMGIYSNTYTFTCLTGSNQVNSRDIYWSPVMWQT